jgi:parallel beta-helix repeat protein
MPICIPISGALSGTLQDTTYYVTGNIFVNGGDSLIIEAGSVFIFNDSAQFDINGYIQATGNENDSIKFINSPGNTWGGIDFNDTASDSSRLEYCLISGGLAEGAFPQNCGGGIFCLYSSPTITNCSISGNIAFTGGGIYCNSSNSAITKCIIDANTASNWGGGIVCAYSNLVMTNCAIIGNISNGNVGGIYCTFSNPAIVNCTISGNYAPEFGGGILCSSSSPELINTIITDNWYFGIYFENSPNVSFDYCDFYNNQGGNFNIPPQWVGQIITTNINGDSCDIYQNIP